MCFRQTSTEMGIGGQLLKGSFHPEFGRGFLGRHAKTYVLFMLYDMRPDSASRARRRAWHGWRWSGLTCTDAHVEVVEVYDIPI